MIPSRAALIPFLTVVFAVPIVGCSGEREAEVAMRRVCLNRLGELYHQYHSEKNGSPTELESFSAFVDEKATTDGKVARELNKRLAERDIVVFWNAEFAEDGESDGDHVLAFEATCPGNGGYMVTVGGTVDHVTAKEFGTMTEVAHEEEK